MHAQRNILHMIYAVKTDDYGLWIHVYVSVLGWGLGQGEKNKNNWGRRLSPNIFSGWTYPRIIACCGYLTPNQKVLIYTTHTKKDFSNFIFSSEKQNNWQTMTGQKFRRGQKFHLTPDPIQIQKNFL